VTATVASLLAEGAERFVLAGLDCARQDALRLLAAVLGTDGLALYVDPRRLVDAAAISRFRALVDRRAAQEPIQHIVGFEEFRGLRIAVTPDVLIPRPETEGLVERALELLADRPGALVADIGTGSGAIACALAATRPDLEVLAVDQSLGALAVASDNVRALGLASRVRLLAGDLFGPLASLSGSLDMIVANPPYIPSGVIPTLPVEVERFEPHLALDGGPDGMRVLRRIIAEAPGSLRPGGWLVMEIGEEQAGPLASLMAAEGFSRIGARRDLRDVERYIEGRWADGAAQVPLTGLAAQRMGC
jgi:release factor glutamine methyltransferase